MKHTISAHIIFSASGAIAPLYRHYPMELTEQPAHVTLDLYTGAIDAEYLADIGATPVDVLRNRMLRWRINPMLTGAEVLSILESYLPKFKAICDGSHVVWNGTDFVGEQFTDEAKAAIDLLDSDSDCMLGDYIESNLIPDLADHLQNAGRSTWMPKPSDDIEDFLSNMQLEGLRILEDPKEVVTNLWVDHLYGGGSLPANVAKYLISTELCSNSKWTEELEAFSTSDLND